MPLKSDQERAVYQKQYQIEHAKTLSAYRKKYYAQPHVKERMKRLLRKRLDAMSPQEHEARRLRASERARRLYTTARGRKVHRKWKYGMSTDEVDAMFEAQGRACAICRKQEPGTVRGWHIDHDHATGDTRGILCQRCNHLVGNALDDIEILDNAIKYLARSRRPRLKLAV